MVRNWLGLVMLVAVVTTPLGAQNIDFGGEIRPRFEVRDPVLDAVGAETTREFTSMRTRLSARVALTERIGAFVQIQDVRLWGSEQSTTDATADALDVHQAWIELGDPVEGSLGLRLGRQELAYGGQRLIGALDWAQQARAFDGARLRYRPGAALTLDGLAMRIGDADAGQPDSGLYGLYATLAAAGSLEGYLFYHTRDAFAGLPPTSEDLSERFTVGGRWAASAAGFDWRLEAAYQDGRIGEPAVTGIGSFEDISAYLVALRAGTRIGPDFGIQVWYDRLSGDDDPDDGTDRVFDTLFATNHKFYGHMDLFTDIPLHTRRRGLQDFAVKAAYRLTDSQTVGADFHSFHLAAADGLESGHIGEELDLRYRWGYAPGVALTGGLSYFLAGDAMPLPAAPAVGPDEGMVWGYAMLSVTF